MSYTPIIPMAGYAGWVFLNRTKEQQQAAFVASAEIQNNESYFREKISSVRTAEELVSDRRLLTVALGAFGLDEDIDNKFFIQKILEEGTFDSTSLANKLSDKRYKDFSSAFGFGDYSIPRTVLSDFPDEILQRFEQKQFEVAVGTVDETMRIAMNAQAEIPEIANSETSEKAKWFKIIGSGPLSMFFQTALGLPQSVGALDVDKQVSLYMDKAQEKFGLSALSDLTDADTLDKAVKTFLLRSQVANISVPSTGSVALQLLQGTGGGMSLLL